MSSAGTVFVDVLPDLKGFGSKLQGELGGAQSGFAGLRQSAATAFGDMATLATQAGIALVVGLGASVIKVGVEYNTLEQTSRAAFKTILGSADAANTMMRQLHDFAMTSPFPRQAFIEASQQLLAFGFSADSIIPTLQAIQDTVAATGGSAADIGVLADILSKVRSSATFGVQELNEFALQGVNAAKILGDANGMTEQQFRDSIFGAPLKGQAAIDALMQLIPGLEKQFGGAAAGVKETWVGAVDRIKGAWRDLSSAIIDPFITKTGGGAGVKWANDLADALRALEHSTALKTILGDLDNIVSNVGPKIDSFFGGLKDKISGADLSGLVDKFKGVGDKIGGLEPLLAGAGAGMAAFSLRSIPFIDKLVPPWLPVVAAIAGFVLKTDEGREALQQIGGAAQEAGAILMPALVDAVKGIMPDLQDFIGVIGELVATLLPALATVAASAAPAFASVLGAALEIAVPLLEAFADIISNIPQGVLEVIGVLGGAGAAIFKIVDLIKGAGTLLAGANPWILGLVGVGLAIGAVTALLGDNAAEQKRDADAARGFADAIREAGDATAGIMEHVRAVVRDSPDLARQLNAMGVSADDLGRAVNGSKREWADFRDQFVSAMEKAGASGLLLDALTSGIDHMRTAAQQGKTDADDIGKALGDAGTKADEARAATDRFRQAIRDLHSGVIDVQDTQIRFADGAARLVSALTASAGSLDLNTEAGRRAASALNELIRGSDETVAAMVTQGASWDTIKTKISDNAHVLVYDMLPAFGGNEEAAAQYIAKLNNIPPDVASNIHNTADLAKELARQYKEKLDEIPPTKETELRVTIRTNWQEFINSAPEWVRKQIPHFDTGGLIPGAPGTPVPIIAHAGEVVLPTDIVDKIKSGAPLSGAEAWGPITTPQGAGGDTFTFGDVHVHGVQDPAVARQVGREFAAGVIDQRRNVHAARVS